MRESQVKLVHLNSKYVGQSRTEEVSETFKNNNNTFYLKKKTQCKYRLKPMHALS